MVIIENTKERFVQNLRCNDMPVVLIGKKSENNKICESMKLKYNHIDIFSFDIDNNQNMKNLIDQLINISSNQPCHILMGTEKTLEVIISSIIENKEKINAIVYKEYNLELPENDSLSFFERDKNKLVIKNTNEWIKTAPWYLNFIYNKPFEIDKNYISQIAINTSRFIKDGIMMNEDIESKYVNIIQGIRYTINSPTSFENSIYLLGDSRTYGALLEDADTISSKLQELFNRDKKQISYRVVNLAVTNSDLWDMKERLKKLNIKKGDIVLCLTGRPFKTTNKKNDYGKEDYELYGLLCIKEMFEYCKRYEVFFGYCILPWIRDIKNPSMIEKFLLKLERHFEINEKEDFFKNIVYQKLDINRIYWMCVGEGIPVYDLLNMIQRPHKMGELFLDEFHFGPNGTKLIANFLYNVLILKINLLKKSGIELENLKNAMDHFLQDKFKDNQFDISIEMYVNQLKKVDTNSSNIGCIVMNCNPFTRGHKYLIETALKNVEYLYIFVVEENKSIFDFNDRFNMVNEGTKELDKVIVVPSGKFIISTITFPEYFDKENYKENMTINATDDLEIFGEKIAAVLNIKKRFVGEEPFCKVTNQYNQNMKRILPQYGIEVIEIPRLKSNGKEISATTVRELLSKKQYGQLMEIVPSSTYDYLIRMQERK